MRGCVSVLPPTEAPGKLTFTTVPAGAITLIGRKHPEFFGIEGSVQCRMALKLADCVTPRVALMAPRACLSDPVKSTMISSPWICAVTAIL